MCPFAEPANGESGSDWGSSDHQSKIGESRATRTCCRRSTHLLVTSLQVAFESMQYLSHFVVRVSPALSRFLFRVAGAEGTLFWVVVF